jgi:hypothetical protein
MCCDHEHPACAHFRDYKKENPLALKADTSFSVVASHVTASRGNRERDNPKQLHSCRCRGFQPNIRGFA